MKFKCAKCGSENLHLYKEMVSIEYRMLNKNGTIKKKPFRKEFDSFSSPDHIDCGDCGEYHDYDTDEKGRVISISGMRH